MHPQPVLAVLEQELVGEHLLLGRDGQVVVVQDHAVIEVEHRPAPRGGLLGVPGRDAVAVPGEPAEDRDRAVREPLLPLLGGEELPEHLAGHVAGLVALGARTLRAGERGARDRDGLLGLRRLRDHSRGGRLWRDHDRGGLLLCVVLALPRHWIVDRVQLALRPLGELVSPQRLGDLDRPVGEGERGDHAGALVVEQLRHLRGGVGQRHAREVELLAATLVQHLGLGLLEPACLQRLLAPARERLGLGCRGLLHHERAALAVVLGLEPEVAAERGNCPVPHRVLLAGVPAGRGRCFHADP